MTSRVLASLVSVMSVSPSPFARVLAWLTVSVCILAGAPFPRHSAGLRTGQQRMETSDALAKDFVVLDRDAVRSSSASPFVKIWDILGAPFGPQLVLPLFPRLRKIAASRAAPPGVRRAFWIGEVELRI